VEASQVLQECWMVVPVFMTTEESQVNNDKAWSLSYCIGVMDEDALTTWDIDLAEELVELTGSPEELLTVFIFIVILNL
jgi:hypothetical protein